jgi:hypothetical protein
LTDTCFMQIILFDHKLCLINWVAHYLVIIQWTLKVCTRQILINFWSKWILNKTVAWWIVYLKCKG